LSSQATTLGVMREPSSFTITFGSRPSMIATTLLVVPRSIPIILPMASASESSPKREGATLKEPFSRTEQPGSPMNSMCLGASRRTLLPEGEG